jgi:glucose-6-phosphate isomerase
VNLPIWRRLESHRDHIRDGHLREWFATDPGRFPRLSGHIGDLLVDYSKHIVTDETLALLRELARERRVEELRDRMFAGARINTTENRPVLHVALRNRSSRSIVVDGRDVMPDVRAALDHIRQFSAAVRKGTWTGYTGRGITDVVNIGIGRDVANPASRDDVVLSCVQNIHDARDDGECAYRAGMVPRPSQRGAARRQTFRGHLD